MSKAAILGSLIDDRFLIKSELGDGGFASIYRASQAGFDRDVAIKLLHSQFQNDADSLGRFEREARTIAGFTHKNIVACYAYGVWLGQVPYLVFELLSGKTLRQILATEGPLSWERTFQIGAHLCSALTTAHAAGVIHRDIKPENIFITDDGTVKLIDFGLSRICKQQLTQTGTLVGTAQYMSPEQSLGEKVTGAADIYSLACVLYECITGRPPFESDNPFGLMYLHRTEQVPPIVSSTAPDFVNNILSRGLAKDVADRFESANEFEQVLQNPAVSAPLKATKLRPVWDRNHTWLKSSYAPYLVAVALTIFILSMIFVPTDVLIRGVQMSADLVSAPQRAEFYKNAAEKLVMCHHSDAATIVLTEACESPGMTLAERLMLSKETMTMMEKLNDTGAISRPYKVSVDALMAMTDQDACIEATRLLALRSVTLDDRIRSQFRLDRTNIYRFAAGNVGALCINVGDDNGWLQCQLIAMRSVDQKTNLSGALQAVDRLMETKRWELLRRYIQELKHVSKSDGAANFDTATLYRSLENAVIAREQGWDKSSRSIISATLPWLRSTALPEESLVIILVTLMDSALFHGDLSDLNALYAVMSTKHKSHPFENPILVSYFETLKAGSLIVKHNGAAALTVLREQLERANDEGARRMAGRLIASTAEKSSTRKVFTRQQLVEAISLLTKYHYPEWQTEVAGIHHGMALSYADEHNYSGTAAQLEPCPQLLKSVQGLHSYSIWVQELATTLDESKDFRRSDALIDRAIELQNQAQATDAELCELLSLKALHLARRHDKRWVELDHRATSNSNLTYHQPTVDYANKIHAECLLLDR